MCCRKILTAVILSFCFQLSSNPGDTTWVTVFSNLKPEDHGNYDTTVAFPEGKRFRKIRLHYLLGRYACAGNPQYCGSWDYTTQIFALPEGKDTVELGRVITPYATDWLQKNKSHNYILDVTDYASVLQDSTHIRFRYDGYSWGFTFTLKFEMIEGTPPMDAVSVEKVYSGFFNYGNAGDPIENKLAPTALTYTTARAALRNTITGHGADNQGCSEFCSKYYNVLINNQQSDQKQLWRDDCGSNVVYPQTGTWVFDRANWCPGAVVRPVHHFLDGITTPSGTFTADINMEPYINGTPSGGYIFETQLVSYTDMNFFTDGSIDDIITPSLDDDHGRQNPACANPVIRLKNTGAGDLYSVKFEYGLTGRTLAAHTWTGQLKSLESTEVVFPADLPVMAHSVSAQFEARITEVNDMPSDQNTENNIYYGKTKPVTIVPDDFVVELGTNKSIAGTVSETSWQLINENGVIVAERKNAAPSKIYRDTIKDLAPGCYRFQVTDAGCDGIDWWYYQYYPVNPGKGNLRIDKLGQFNTIFSFPGDFGCGFSRQFLVGSYPLPPAIPNPPGFEEFFTRNHVDLYPNPAENSAILQLNLEQKGRVKYELRDVSGRVIRRADLGTVGLHYETIDCSGISPGIYLVELNISGSFFTTRKLMIR